MWMIPIASNRLLYITPTDAQMDTLNDMPVWVVHSHVVQHAGQMMFPLSRGYFDCCFFIWLMHCTSAIIRLCICSCSHMRICACLHSDLHNCNEASLHPLYPPLYLRLMRHSFTISLLCWLLCDRVAVPIIWYYLVVLCSHMRICACLHSVLQNCNESSPHPLYPPLYLRLMRHSFTISLLCWLLFDGVAVSLIWYYLVYCK